MSDITFANGIIFKRSDNAPEFVIGGLSIKKSEFIPFLEDQGGDWVNLQIKIAKSGKPYIAVDTWKPNSSQNSIKEEQKPTEFANDPSTNDDLPF